MKIYFAGSIRGGREDVNIYMQIIDYLRKFGEILTEHVKNKDITSYGEIHLSDKDIHDRDLAWIKEADIIVAEVSTPSLGVGYEIAKASDMNKKILCIFKEQPEKKLSAMIAGCPGILVKNYKSFDDAKKILDKFFNKL